MRMTVAALALACATLPALAQSGAAPSSVSLPLAPFAASLAHWLAEAIVPAAASVAAGFLCRAIAKTYPWAALFLSQQRVEMMVRAAADYALNAVEGAAKGKTLSVEVGSRVIAEAVQYAIDQAPARVVKAAGGREGIALRVFRTLDLSDDASAGNTLPPAIGKSAVSRSAA